MFRRTLFNFAILLTLLSVTEAHAANTLRVPADFATIQGAIDAAASGDTVLVSDGTYLEHIDFKGKGITVTSVNGAAATILDGQLLTIPVVNFQTGESRAAVFSGFTVRRGAATFGSGMSMLLASPTIVDNIFDGNLQGSGGFGAGIGGNNASPDIERNIFRNHACDSQFTSGVISFVNSSSPVIADNLIVNNNCRGINMTLPVGSVPVTINNTIVANTSGIRVDARVATAQQVFANNIIVGNTIGLEVEFLLPGNEPTWNHNLLFNNSVNYQGIGDLTGANSNVAVDPQFIDAATDFHLKLGSPAIDTGDNAAPRITTRDFENRARVLDGTGDCNAVVDLGAFEFQPPLSASFIPTAPAFGNVPVNTTGTAQNIAFTNTGQGCLAINTIQVSGNFLETSNCGTQLTAASSCNLSVSFKPSVTGAVTGTLSVSTNASTSPHSATLRGTGVDFTLSGSPSTVTIAPGGTAQYTIAVVQQGGSYPSPVTLQCTGLPSLANCAFSAASVTPSADATSGGVTLTITTSPPTLAGVTAPRLRHSLALWLGLPALLWCSPMRCSRRKIRLAGTIFVFVLLATMAACGGGGGGSQPRTPQGGTPRGTYTITISGSAPAASHSTTVVLQVS